MAQCAGARDGGWHQWTKGILHGFSSVDHSVVLGQLFFKRRERLLCTLALITAPAFGEIN